VSDPTASRGQTKSGLPFWVRSSDAPTWVTITHGSFGRHDDFDSLSQSLASRFNVLAWDLPGHGDASAQAGLRSYDTLANHLVEIMDAAGVSRSHQMGFSFGGMVAQKFAQLHPDRCASLIGYGCVPIFRTKLPSRLLAHALIKLQFATTPWRQFCSSFAQQVTVDPLLEREFFQQMVRHPPRVRDAIWAAMIDGARYEPDFAFACQVAHICGAKDDRFAGAREAMLEWTKTLRPELVAEIADAGHWAHRERPTAFSTALLGILERLERG
jgi:pimeloyl-ACP methyl ester carboxylesterase